MALWALTKNLEIKIFALRPINRINAGLWDFVPNTFFVSMKMVKHEGNFCFITEFLMFTSKQISRKQTIVPGQEWRTNSFIPQTFRRHTFRLAFCWFSKNPNKSAFLQGRRLKEVKIILCVFKSKCCTAKVVGCRLLALHKFCGRCEIEKLNLWKTGEGKL